MITTIRERRFAEDDAERDTLTYVALGVLTGGPSLWRDRRQP